MRRGRMPAGALAVVVAAACSSGTSPSVAAPRSLPPATSTTSAPASTTTSTTVDPGTLPQTAQQPSGTDVTFSERIRSLWEAVTSGDASAGLPAFFPIAAYAQVKELPDPVGDWHTRLIAEFDRDIAAVHASVGAGARFVDIVVPPTAVWVRPGQEANRIGYWRVYNSRIDYTSGGRPGSIVVISMISWRGQWYVVHFRTPPR